MVNFSQTGLYIIIFRKWPLQLLWLLKMLRSNWRTAWLHTINSNRSAHSPWSVSTGFIPDSLWSSTSRNETIN